MQNLTVSTLRIISNSSLSSSDKAALRCELAKELEEIGDYEAAREALAELWRGVGERPALDELDEKAGALVLLRAGALTGFLGTVRQISGAQEAAKDLVGESLRKFEALGMMPLAVEAQYEMALCYWREGAFDEARVILRDARRRLEEIGDEKHVELKARVLLRAAIVEFKSQRFDRALEFLHAAGAPIAAGDNHVLKGKYHGELATTLRHLAGAQGRAEYMDRALVEYAASNFHFEEAGHFRYCARGENNLAMLFLALGRYDEAHQHLDRADRLFARLQDESSVAQVAETRARVFLAEGRNAEAERSARISAEILTKGSEQALLAEALTTRGAALARLGREAAARAALESAIEIAEGAGDAAGGGRAALTIIEELAPHLDVSEMCKVYERADQLLVSTEHKETGARLLSGARRVLSEVHQRLGGAASLQLPMRREESVEGENNYSLPQAVRRYEAELIRGALDANGGSITAAAHQLGVPHQTLSAIIRRRHKNFLDSRKPRKPRRVRLILEK